MTRRNLRLFALAMLLSAPVIAGPMYTITIDTSSLTGDGAIYFQFNPGVGSDPASVTISPFTVGTGTILVVPPPGALVPSGGTGGFTGGLNPPPLILDNSGGLNDYLQFLTYGDEIVFSVEFNLPTLLTPGASGSVFSFVTTGEDGLTPVLVADPAVDFLLADISYDDQGAFTVNKYSNAVSMGSQAIPEPGTLGLGLAGFLTLLWRLRAPCRRVRR